LNKKMEEVWWREYSGQDVADTGQTTTRIMP
jgi:hypothetical protein